MKDRGQVKIHKYIENNNLFVDILVNNAAMGISRRFKDYDTQKLLQLIALNLRASSHLMQLYLPGMLARARGGIINVASLAGFFPGPYQAAYYASKAYMISLSESVAYEIEGRGVQLTIVAPGPVDTGFHASMGAATARYAHLIGRQDPKTVAKAAVAGFKKGKRLVTPGFGATCIYTLGRILPRRMLAPVVWKITKSRHPE